MTQTPPGSQYGPHAGSQHGPQAGSQHGPQAGAQTGRSSGPSGGDNFFAGLRQIDLRRSSDSWIGGVCSGLAERLGIDPIVVRALFVILSIAMGAGVLLYAVAWLVIPDQQGTTHLEKAVRGGEAGSVTLLVVAVISLFGTFGAWGSGPSMNGFWTVISLALVALGAWWLWNEWSRRADPGYYTRRAKAQEAYFAADPSTGTGTTADAGVATESGTMNDPGASGATAWQPTPEFGTGGLGGPGGTGGPSGPSVAGGPGGPRVRAPKPPRAPRRPQRRSAGAAGTLLGTGLALAVGGGLYWAADEYAWGINPMVIAILGALAALGLVVLILGLAGRTSGFPGFLAVCALVLAMLAVPLGNNFVISGQVGDITWRPDAATSDTGPFRLGAGTGTLDLTGVDPEGMPDPIVASVSAGNLVIVVPEDLTVRIEAGAGAGSVPTDGELFSGINVNQTVTVGDGPIDLEVKANVGLGQVLVEGDGQ